MDASFIQMLINSKTREKFRSVYNRWVLYRWATLTNNTELVKKSGAPIDAFSLLPKGDTGVDALMKIRDVYVFEDKNTEGVLESFKWLNEKSSWVKHPIFPDQFLHMPLFVIPPMFHVTYIDTNIRELMTEQAKLYTKLLSNWYTSTPLVPQLSPIKKRIGFLSRTIAVHSVGRVIYGLIERLSEHFEVYVYVDERKYQGDAIVDILRPKVKLFKILPNLQDNVRMIVSHQLGTMVYPDPLEDMTTYIFGCHRLAPVQISTWGHPGTTGLPYIDYYVTSKHFKDSQQFYSEKLIEFNSLSMYYEHLNRIMRPVTEPNLDVRTYLASRRPGMGRERFGIPVHGKNIYGTVGPPCKFSPEFITVVREILDKDPNGLLVLTHNHKTKIHDRCIILPRELETLEFSLYIYSCDVILDSFPFGGLISAYDTLTVGRSLIVKTCHRLGRFAAGFYRYMGLEDLIAKDDRDYVEKALRVANDPAFRNMFELRIVQNVHKIHSDEPTIKDWTRLLNSEIPAIKSPIGVDNV